MLEGHVGHKVEVTGTTWQEKATSTDGDRQFEGHLEPDECRFDEPAGDARRQDSENALDDLFIVAVHASGRAPSLGCSALPCRSGQRRESNLQPTD